MQERGLCSCLHFFSWASASATAARPPSRSCAPPWSSLLTPCPSALPLCSEVLSIFLQSSAANQKRIGDLQVPLSPPAPCRHATPSAPPRLPLLSSPVLTPCAALPSACFQGVDGLDLLLQIAAYYRRRNPAEGDEQECCENVFNCLCR